MKCMTTKTYLKNGGFRQKMSNSFLICPQRIRANRVAVTEALDRHNALLSEATKKRILNHHSSNAFSFKNFF